MKKVSVLIPCYNAGQYLSQTIESVLNQSYQHIEVIVVDDGSTDNSYEIANQYGSDGVLVVRQENGGACKARNLAFAMSTGEYIQYLDADDILTPDKISSQVELLEKNTGSISATKWEKFTTDPGSSSPNELSIFRNFENPVDLMIQMWRDRTMMQTSVWLVPRDILSKAGKWDESLSINQDGEFFCRVMLCANSIIFSEKGKVLYRTDVPGSVSVSKGSRKKAESLLKSYLLYINHLSHLLTDNEIRQALATNLYSFIYIYYHLYDDLVKTAMDKLKDLNIPPVFGKVGGGGFERFAPLLGFYNVLRLRRLKYKMGTLIGKTK